MKRDAEATKLLESLDWSAASDEFLLAASILKRDFARGSMIMRRLSKKIIDESDYREWPLFSEFRGTPEFAAAFKRKFGKEFKPIALTKRVRHALPRQFKKGAAT